MFEPRALDELFPKWSEQQGEGQAFADLPLRQKATADRFYMLTQGSSIRLPNPPQMKNRGKNYIISLRCVREEAAAARPQAGVTAAASQAQLYDQCSICSRLQWLWAPTSSSMRDTADRTVGVIIEQLRDLALTQKHQAAFESKRVVSAAIWQTAMRFHCVAV